MIKYPTRPAACVSLIFLLAIFIGTARAAFEESVVGARPAAMGEAFSAIADDANALSVNPAGLGWIQHRELATSYSRLYMGLTDGSNLGSGGLAYTQPFFKRGLPKGAVGVGWQSFGLSQFYAEEIFILSYGRQILADWQLPRFYAGTSLKWMRKDYKLGADPTAAANPYFKQYGLKAAGLSLDIGFLWRPLPNYSLAYSMSNVNRPDIGLHEKDLVPHATRLGFAFHGSVFNAAVEGFSEPPLQSLHVGAEQWLAAGRFAMRGGFIFGNRDMQHLTAGFGLRASALVIDYAFRLPVKGIESTNGTHRLSLTMRFGRRPKRALTQGAEEPATEQELMLREHLRREKIRLDAKTRRIKELTEIVQELETRLHPKQADAAVDMADVREWSDLTPQDLLRLKEELTQTRILLEQTKQEMLETNQRLRRAQAPPQPQPEKSSGAGKMRLHTVQSGETLRSLALFYYGQADFWIEIYRANRHELGRGGEVKPGQTVAIPALKKGE